MLPTTQILVVTYETQLVHTMTSFIRRAYGATLHEILPDNDGTTSRLPEGDRVYELVDAIGRIVCTGDVISCFTYATNTMPRFKSVKEN